MINSGLLDLIGNAVPFLLGPYIKNVRKEGEVRVLKIKDKTGD